MISLILGRNSAPNACSPPSSKRVHETHALQVVVDVVEHHRVQHLADEVRGIAVGGLARARHRHVARRIGRMPERDQQQPIGAEAKRRRERRVQAQAAVAIEVPTDPHGGEEAAGSPPRPGCATARSPRRAPRRTDRTPRASELTRRAVDEDDRASGGDLGARDAEHAARGPQVAPQLAPRNLLAAPSPRARWCRGDRAGDSACVPPAAGRVVTNGMLKSRAGMRSRSPRLKR